MNERMGMLAFLVGDLRKVRRTRAGLKDEQKQKTERELELTTSEDVAKLVLTRNLLLRWRS